MAMFRQKGQIQELERTCGLEIKVGLLTEQWALSQLEELKKLWFEQQTLKDAHEAEIRRYIDIVTSEELKAKDYKKDLLHVKAELRLEC